LPLFSEQRAAWKMTGREIDSERRLETNSMAGMDGGG
jgi:hypothetical protein